MMRTMTMLTLMGALLMGAGTTAHTESKLSGADYAEIQMLYARYNYAFDSSNPAMYGGVFTTDGEFVIGDRTLRGQKEIGELAAGRGPLKPRPKIFHISTNVLIEPAPEGAKGSSYVTLIDLQKNPAVTGGGTYEDAIVKTAEGWRFKRRSYFSEAAPAEPAP
jgi:hypothetical protein